MWGVWGVWGWGVGAVSGMLGGAVLVVANRAMGMLVKLLGGGFFAWGGKFHLGCGLTLRGERVSN